jgi:hypothetical protein
LPDQPHLNKLQADNYEIKEKIIEYQYNDFAPSQA